MATRGPAALKVPRYCAEHRHDIPSFARARSKLKSLDDYKEWLEFDKVNAARTTKIVTTAAAAGALIAPAAFFMAPAIGGILGASALGGELTGAAAVSHGLAMLGGGSLASGGLGMAGGAVVITAVGSTMGMYQGMSVASAYVGADKSFAIKRLRKGEGAPIVFSSGFLTEKDEGWGGWQRLIDERYPNRPVYRVLWGNKELAAINSLALRTAWNRTATQAAAQAASVATKAGSKKLPLIGLPLMFADLAKNPWSVARQRADMTGAVLGIILSRMETDGCVLLGHSLGGRVMAAAAQTLGSDPNAGKLESVHLLAAAIPARTNTKELTAGVETHVYNYYSRADIVLSRFYRAAEFGDTAAGSVGLKIPERRVKNVDCTPKIGSHSEYLEKISLARG